MAKTSHKLSRAEVMRELELFIARGRSLAESPIDDLEPLALALVERLEWQHAAAGVLRHLPRGNVQVYADFNRAGAEGQNVFFATLDDEVAHYRQVVETQLTVLDQALTKLKNSRTRPLTQG